LKGPKAQRVQTAAWIGREIRIIKPRCSCGQGKGERGGGKTHRGGEQGAYPNGQLAMFKGSGGHRAGGQKGSKSAAINLSKSSHILYLLRKAGESNSWSNLGLEDLIRVIDYRGARASARERGRIWKLVPRNLN